MSTNPFLQLAAADAVTTFVAAKLAGGTDQAAQEAARSRLAADVAAAVFAPGEAEKWKVLAWPLADVAADGDALELPLLATPVQHDAQVGAWSWRLQTEAGAAFRAEVLDEEQLALLGVEARAGHRVVRYAVQGALSAGVGGGAEVGIWSIGAGVQGAAQARLEWYVAAPEQARLGDALVRALPFLVAPMSLAAQLERAGDFEYWGCAMQLGGTLGASFEAGTAVTGSTWAWGLDGDQAKLGLSLAASGTVALQLAGDFRLRCSTRPAGTRPNGDKRYGIEVVLERLRSGSHAFALELSAGLDAAALAGAADRLLHSHLPADAALDAALALLTQPGQATAGRLRDALAQALADARLQPLLRAAAGLGEPQALAQVLAQRVSAPLADAIDRLAGRLDGSAAQVDGLLEPWLQLAFGPAAALARPGRELLRELLGAHLAGVGSLIDGTVADLAQRLAGAAPDAAGAVLAPLATLGEKIQARLAALAGAVGAADATQAVVQGLADYVALRDRLLAALSDAQRAKIALAAAATVEQTRGAQTFFRAVFVAAENPGPAEALFRALWSGRLERAAPLVAAAVASGAIFGEPEGWLVRVARRTSTLALDINVFGVDIAANRRIKTSELQLKADLAGNLVGHGAGSVDDLVSNYWNQREAHLALSAVQRRSAEGGPTTVEFGFNGAYSAIGRGMTPALFDAMQRALAQVAGGGATIDVRTLLRAPDGAALDDKAFRRNVGFLLPIALAPAEFARFLETDDDTLQRAITRFGLRGLDAEYAGQWGHATPGLQLLELARGAGLQAADDDELARDYLLRFPPRLQRASSTPGPVFEQLGLAPMDDRAPLFRKLRVYHRLARCVRAIVGLRDACRALGATLATAQLADLAAAQATAFAQLRRATDALEHFSLASLTLIGNDEMVAWPFAAFAAALAEAVGRPVPPGFVACAVLRGQEARPIPLIGD
jgi:hypothetical protein